MISESSNTKSELEAAIERYSKALYGSKETNQNQTSQQILKIMLARDTVESYLSKKSEISEQDITDLVELDNFLKSQVELIGADDKLADWRATLKPPESAWWWFLKAENIHKFDRFDWIWDTLTAVSLVVTGSFMVNTFQALSIGGLGVGEAFGTISQAAGLALVGKGALTQDGQETIKKILKKLGIPDYFHSEATAALSTIVLGIAFSINHSLPHIGDMYYSQGRELYNKGNLTEAKDRYEQALNLNPNNIKIHVSLGEVYESLNEIAPALAHYKKAIQENEPKAFNNAGRVHIEKDTGLAEALLRLGLQRVGNDTNTKYQLHRNLGWALLVQKKYPEAEIALKQAVALDNQIEGKQIGGGMAYCLLGNLYDIQNKLDAAQQSWSHCQKYARPETVNEYKWFVKVGKRDIAEKIDTTSVVSKDD